MHVYYTQYVICTAWVLYGDTHNTAHTVQYSIDTWVVLHSTSSPTSCQHAVTNEVQLGPRPHHMERQPHLGKVRVPVNLPHIVVRQVGKEVQPPLQAHNSTGEETHTERCHVRRHSLLVHPHSVRTIHCSDVCRG